MKISPLGLAIGGLAVAAAAGLAGMAFADEETGGAPAAESAEGQTAKTIVTRDGRFAYVGAGNVAVPPGEITIRLTCPKRGI